jgi:hypothetical protein
MKGGDNMDKIVQYISENWIAIISLIISVYTIWKQRIKLTVTFQQNMLIDHPDAVFMLGPNGEIRSHHPTAQTQIEIVNSGTNDVAFFDLRVFDGLTNRNIPFITENTIPIEYPDKKVFTLFDETYYQLDIPKRTFGVFKANSFTKMSIVVILDKLPKELENIDNIHISFKIARNAYFKKDKFAVTNRKKFDFFGMNYSITGWKEMYNKLLQEQQTQLESEKQNKQE